MRGLPDPPGGREDRQNARWWDGLQPSGPRAVAGGAARDDELAWAKPRYDRDMLWSDGGRSSTVAQ